MGDNSPKSKELQEKQDTAEKNQKKAAARVKASHFNNQAPEEVKVSTGSQAPASASTGGCWGSCESWSLPFRALPGRAS